MPCGCPTSECGGNKISDLSPKAVPAPSLPSHCARVHTTHLVSRWPRRVDVGARRKEVWAAVEIDRQAEHAVVVQGSREIPVADHTDCLPTAGGPTGDSIK